jgi:hypothetical protein
MQAGLPEESPLLKISFWMLLNVGSRFGVGPVMSERFSSHPPTATMIAIATAP